MGNIWWRIMGKIRNSIKNINYLGILGLLTVLVLWFLVAEYFKIVNPTRASTIMPAPFDVFTESLKDMASFKYGGEITYGNAFLVIARHSLITVSRLLGGITIGIAMGIVVGILLGMNKYLNRLFALPILIIRSIPPLALLPIFVIWFGGREIGNLVYIALIVFGIIVINTIVAIGNVNPIYTDYAMTLGADKKRTFRTVILPSIIPELSGGIKVVIGVSWAVTLAAEYLGAQSGLGRLMILSEKFLFTGNMVIIIILFMLYSLFLNWIFGKIVNFITRWKEKES